MKTKKRKIV